MTSRSGLKGLPKDMQAVGEGPPRTEGVSDDKTLPLAGSSALVPFAVNLFVVFPVWLCALLPSTLLWQAVSFGGRKLLGGGRRPRAETEAAEDDLTLPADSLPLDQRTYDVVLLGATGFTGGLAAQYLGRQYTDGEVKWAIAGRRKQALEDLKSSLGCPGVDVLLCDTKDAAAVAALVRDTRCVITTAGPFDKYGTPVVRACALYGTAYSDITGESDWVRKNIDQYGAVAAKTGARIVSFCGHDCVPWDLLVFKVAQKLKADFGESLAQVRCYDEIRAEASGGTMATVFHSLEARTQVRTALGFDPFMAQADRSKSEAKTKAQNQAFLGYSSDRGAWTGPFVMAMVMANCVRRSNAVNHYSEPGARPLVYKEAKVYPGFMAAFVETVQLLVLGTSLFCPPLTYLLKKFSVQPGSGPSAATMNKSFLKIKCTAMGDKGTVVKGMFAIDDDPGYRDTARMLVESGLALALNADQIDVGGGIWTPATCQKDVLLKRLEATGPTTCTVTVA